MLITLKTTIYSVYKNSSFHLPLKPKNSAFYDTIEKSSINPYSSSVSVLITLLM